MCDLCKLFDLDPESVTDRMDLMETVKSIKKDHPWVYLVGPMSDEERIWYDLSSPLRKQK